jgi:membrane-bound metal-dependent hydrolase YbcI (DUF457 family)
MRRITHLLIGAAGFLAYTYPLHQFLGLPGNTLLTGFIAALFGSVMPDVVDPPGRWNHRRLGHSRRAMRFSGWMFALTAAIGLFQMSIPGLSLAFILSGFFLGYALHLLADATTPAGLPV